MSKELLESINISVAYLPDLIIDYPNAGIYASEIMDKAVEYQIMSGAEAEKYKLHI